MKGMTLVEAVIAIAFFVVILTAITLFQSKIFSYKRNISGTFETVQNAQIILKSLTRQIRSMTWSANGSYPIFSASTSSITFYHKTKSTDTAPAEVRFFLSSSTIWQGIIDPVGIPAEYDRDDEVVKPIMSNVVNTSTPLFEYYDENFMGTTSAMTYPLNLDLIRLVKINVMLGQETSEGTTTKTYNSLIMLRNLKTNL